MRISDSGEILLTCRILHWSGIQLYPLFGSLGLLVISNGNQTERSTFQGVIRLKSAEDIA